MTDYFNERCLCGRMLYVNLVCREDEVYWCDWCGRMIITYKGLAPDITDWNTPKLAERYTNG